MKKESWQRLGIVGIYAIAMAFLESVIVVYLRKLYYPAGFDFPLVASIEKMVLNIEWTREFFTIVMLICIGWLAGKKFYDKFAYFLYAFAVWDIFYYVWLKVILGWPVSLLTWDLLFLIPFPWASPVLAPVIYSIDITILAVVLIHLQDRFGKVKMKLSEWGLFVLGSAIILYTFLEDYAKLLLASNGLEDFMAKVSIYTPLKYSWVIYFVGEIVILISIFAIYYRTTENANII